MVYSVEKETFYSYFTDPNDWSTISMNHVLSLAIDYDGTLWAGTMWGINRVITKNDNDLNSVRFERIIPSDTSNQYNFIYSITPHPSGALWLRTQRCIYQFTGHNKDNYTFIKHWEYSITGRNLSAFLSAPVFDSQNNLYFIYNGQPRQIIWFDQKDQQIKTLNIDIEPYLDKENAFMLRKIFIDSSDVLWVAVEKRGFFRYDLKKQPFEIMLTGKDVYGIYKTPGGKLFAGSRTGLNIYDPATSNWSLLTPENNNTMIWHFPGTLRPANQNQLRIGFWDGLAGIYNIENNTFTNFEYRFDDSTSLSTWSVREIFEDNNNNIWMGGTDNGLTLMADTEGVFHYFLDQPNPERNYPEQGALSISQDASGNLLIGSRINGLMRTGGKLRPIRAGQPTPTCHPEITHFGLKQSTTTGNNPTPQKHCK